MVWYGMVWYGMGWGMVVWYGMVWYGRVWYGVVWYGMVWFRALAAPLWWSYDGCCGGCRCHAVRRRTRSLHLF